MKRTGVRRAAVLLVAALLLPLVALAAPSSISPAGAQAGGAVVIMGIDAEEGGPDGHGPVANYEQIVTAILDSSTNGGSGIAVMGGGASTDVEAFWNQIATDLGETVTFFVGTDAIANADIDAFAMVAISSGITQTGSGGISNEDNDALTARAFEFVDLVNAGGGLLGFSQEGLTTNYAYMGDFGTFTSQGVPQYSDITPTPEGEAIGLTDVFNGACCWHDEFLEWPSFLQVLANHTSTGEAIALGGFDVAIPTGCVLEPASAAVATGDPYTATARATESGEPAVGIPVVFEVTSGPNAGKTGNATTDATGAATFTYTSSAVGVDEVAAAFTDSQQRVRNCNLVTVQWAQGAPAAPVTPAAAPVARTPAFTG